MSLFSVFHSHHAGQTTPLLEGNASFAPLRRQFLLEPTLLLPIATVSVYFLYTWHGLGSRRVACGHSVPKTMRSTSALIKHVLFPFENFHFKYGSLSTRVLLVQLPRLLPFIVTFPQLFLVRFPSRRRPFFPRPWNVSNPLPFFLNFFSSPGRVAPLSSP